MTTCSSNAASVIALLVSASAALAQTPPAAPADKTTPDNEVVVVAPRDPKVVSTFPKDGDTVRSGALVLKVIFDQPMTPLAWSFAQTDSGALPACLAQPRLLADKRTFVLLCSVAGNKDYAIQINANPLFLSAKGKAAIPYRLHFTTMEMADYTMHDALIEAGLTDADEPIMTWNGAAGGSLQHPGASDPADDPPKP